MLLLSSSLLDFALETLPCNYLFLILGPTRCVINTVINGEQRNPPGKAVSCHLLLFLQVLPFSFLSECSNLLIQDQIWQEFTVTYVTP
jgi:hypothetical protein